MRDDITSVAYLEQLACALILRGWYAAVVQPLGGPPFARITNPACPAFSDTLVCYLGASGQWEYRWRWGDHIGPARDLSGAAEHVTRVLGAGT